MNISFRPASPQDAQAVHDIYQYYVNNTVYTFNTLTPSVETYAAKINHTNYPFLVAMHGVDLIGFAYAEAIRPHDAYQWDVELTIYLHPQAPQKCGIGSGLYKMLLALLSDHGFINAYAVITAGNTGSIRFHESFGFTQTAFFHNMGYKHGSWHDVLWLHKVLGPYTNKPSPPTPFQ